MITQENTNTIRKALLKNIRYKDNESKWIKETQELLNNTPAKVAWYTVPGSYYTNNQILFVIQEIRFKRR